LLDCQAEVRRKEEEREQEEERRARKKLKNVNVTEAKEKERVLKLYAIKMAANGSEDVKSNKAKGEW